MLVHPSAIPYVVPREFFMQAAISYPPNSNFAYALNRSVASAPSPNERLVTPVQEVSQPPEEKWQQMFEDFKAAIGGTMQSLVVV
jgi:hypothetical protein